VRRSTDRILVSHVGVLPRPSAFDEVLAAEGASQPEFERVLSGAVGQENVIAGDLLGEA
jgi:hypothetical protein